MSNFEPRLFLKHAGAGFALTAIGLHAQPSGSGRGMIDVRTLGAKGDGKTIDTPAINKAIDAMAASGGGSYSSPPAIISAIPSA